ncbi:MAG: permease-like cell division protein FtsX [Caldicoprobacterales bacterium]|nr:ABC transporter permease [Clostridiales bacterium]
MKIRTWKRMVKQGFRNLFRNRIMSLASVSAIAAALFVLGLVLAVVMNMNNMVSGLESKVEVTVFLKENIRQADIDNLDRQINSWEGISERQFISRQEALNTWKEEWGDKRYLLDGYNEENNPLPDSFRITVEKPEFVEEIVEKAKKSSMVEKVQYSKDVVDSITNIASTARVFGLMIVGVLIAMAMVIIHNTIRISVYSRRREINIMKYIGATDWYIRWPFLMEGMLLGLIGAVVSGGLIGLVYSLLEKRMSSSPAQSNLLSLFQILPLNIILYPILALFIVVGGIVGISASLLSMRKHLRV